MLLLILYVMIALGFSFLCSIAESVLLSVTRPYIALLMEEGRPVAHLLKKLKEDIHSPLAAILTLNTVAHTVGAAGAGAQAAAVFGSHYVGIISAVLTLLILIFSEIIPKTLGAHYWRQLAPTTAYCLKFLIWVLYPFVWLSNKMTSLFNSESGSGRRGLSRDEFTAMTRLVVEEGQLDEKESRILENVLRLRETRVKDAMTPYTVVFRLPEDYPVIRYSKEHSNQVFSRIPIYGETQDQITGFVLRSDLLAASPDSRDTIKRYRRDIPVTLPTMSLTQAFDRLLHERTHIMLVVNEYGGMVGILTLEDVLETLLGLEIIDESDTTVDMQKLARRLWKERAEKMGITIPNMDHPTEDMDDTEKK